MFALFEIKFIKLPMMDVESPMKSAISLSVSKTAGAEPTSFEISVAVSVLVYASIPLIVIELSVDVKLILSPGIEFLILLLINNVFEFVTSVALLNVACLFVISVLIVCIFVFISSLFYASTAVIVKLLSSSVSDKLTPTIFFNLDVVVCNKLLLFVISVPLLSVFCFFINICINCLYFCCNFIFIICINRGNS